MVRTLIFIGLCVAAYGECRWIDRRMAVMAFTDAQPMTHTGQWIALPVENAAHDAWRRNCFAAFPDQQMLWRVLCPPQP